jgi:hypothetical protein
MGPELLRSTLPQRGILNGSDFVVHFPQRVSDGSEPSPLTQGLVQTCARRQPPGIAAFLGLLAQIGNRAGFVSARLKIEMSPARNRTVPLSGKPRRQV